jgi:hypothetical protein
VPQRERDNVAAELTRSNGSDRTRNAPFPSRWMAAKACAKSSRLCTARTWSCTRNARCTLRVVQPGATVRLGRAGQNGDPRRYRYCLLEELQLFPTELRTLGAQARHAPPGCARLAVHLAATGSPPPAITIGSVRVACCVARIAGSPGHKHVGRELDQLSC